MYAWRKSAQSFPLNLQLVGNLLILYMISLLLSRNLRLFFNIYMIIWHICYTTHNIIWFSLAFTLPFIFQLSLCLYIYFSICFHTCNRILILSEFLQNCCKRAWYYECYFIYITYLQSSNKYYKGTLQSFFFFFILLLLLQKFIAVLALLFSIKPLICNHLVHFVLLLCY